jgi:hypothetical protein
MSPLIYYYSGRRLAGCWWSSRSLQAELLCVSASASTKRGWQTIKRYTRTVLRTSDSLLVSASTFHRPKSSATTVRCCAVKYKKQEVKRRIILHLWASQKWNDYHFNAKAHLNNISSDRTAKKTHCVSITKINWLMLFKETVSVYNEAHMRLIHTKYSLLIKQVLHIVTTGF